jgi:hypothetical protein
MAHTRVTSYLYLCGESQGIQEHKIPVLAKAHDKYRSYF